MMKKTVADSLPYLGLNSKTESLWLKDGSATRTFRVVPRNSLSATDEDLEGLRAGLNNLISQLPEGTLLQVFFTRKKVGTENDPALVRWKKSHEVEGANVIGLDARKSLFESRLELLKKREKTDPYFQTDILVTVRVTSERFRNPASLQGPLSFLSAFNRSKATRKSQIEVEAELGKISQGLRQSFETMEFEVSNVSPQERLSFIYRYLNPDRDQPMSEVVDTIDIDDLMISDYCSLTDMIETREGLQLGKSRIRIASLKNLPESSTPALFIPFAMQTQEFTLVTTTLILNQTNERERLSRRQRVTQALSAGTRVRNLQAETQLQDIEDTLIAMIARGEKLVSISHHFIMKEDKNDPFAFPKMLENAARSGSGSQWFEETVGAYPVFFSTLPFAPTFITRPKRVLSGVASDLLPLYGIGPGHEEASVLFETDYKSLFGFSLFEKSPTGNGILIGSTGSGKSTLACGLILGMVAAS